MCRLLLALLASAGMALLVSSIPARAEASADGPRPLQQAIDDARTKVDWMVLRSDRIQDWLAQARRQRDPARTSCLDDMLNQSHAVERIGQGELEAIIRAVRSGDGDSLDRRRTRLGVVAVRSEQLMALASSCITTPRRR